MFYDKNSFGSTDNRFHIIDENEVEEIKTKYYFLEAVDMLLKFNEENTNVFSDASDDIKDAFNKGQKHVHNGLQLICKNIQIYLQKTIKSYCKDFALIYTRDARELKKDLNELKSYKGPAVEMHDTLYKFSCPKNVPDFSPLEDAIEELMKFADSIISAKNPNDIKLDVDIEYNNLYDEIHNADYYTRVRKEVMHTSQYIEAKDYSNAIFEAFRSGGEPISNIISAEEVRSIAKNFDHYKQLTKDVTTSNDKLFKIFSSMEKYSIDLNNAVNACIHDESTLKSYNKYLVLKHDQLYKVTEIYMLATCGMLDAIMCKYKQEISILKQAQLNLGKEALK